MLLVKFTVLVGFVDPSSHPLNVYSLPPAVVEDGMMIRWAPSFMVAEYGVVRFTQSNENEMLETPNELILNVWVGIGADS